MPGLASSLSERRANGNQPSPGEREKAPRRLPKGTPLEPPDCAAPRLRSGGKESRRRRRRLETPVRSHSHKVRVPVLTSLRDFLAAAAAVAALPQRPGPFPSRGGCWSEVTAEVPFACGQAFPLPSVGVLLPPPGLRF